MRGTKISLPTGTSGVVVILVLWRFSTRETECTWRLLADATIPSTGITLSLEFFLLTSCCGLYTQCDEIVYGTLLYSRCLFLHLQLNTETRSDTDKRLYQNWKLRFIAQLVWKGKTNGFTSPLSSGVATGEHWGNIGGTLGEHCSPKNCGRVHLLL